MSLSGHQSAAMKSDTWLTPPEWIEKLGPFDLDPCCPAEMPWRTAGRMVSLPEDGLTTEWRGRVWLNPPFGREATKWLAKLVAHGNGIALVPARTETEMFFRFVWPKATAICFTGPHRPHFHYPDGRRAPFNSGAPIALIAYGPANAIALKEANLGHTVELTSRARSMGV